MSPKQDVAIAQVETLQTLGRPGVPAPAVIPEYLHNTYWWAYLHPAGVRLFDHLADTPVVLGTPTVIAGVGVTHLRYPVRADACRCSRDQTLEAP